MKNQIARILIAASILTASLAIMPIGCTTGNIDQKITADVKTAATFALQQVPQSEQLNVANYYDVGAKALRSVDGTPTVQELTAIVVEFIPQNVRDQYPLIASSITAVVTFAYQTYGKSALADAATGLEAAAATVQPPPQIHVTAVSTSTKTIVNMTAFTKPIK